uniref:F-box domain-containing protein n=1 Tax=Nothoprocta perdicaria TaxID=30464 RepID=A0A8C6Z725_NOTPE
RATLVLPHHVILRIFQFLPLVDRARASSVCRRWNETFHVPELWRSAVAELFYTWRPCDLVA